MLYVDASTAPLSLRSYILYVCTRIVQHPGRVQIAASLVRVSGSCGEGGKKKKKGSAIPVRSDGLAAGLAAFLARERPPAI